MYYFSTIQHNISWIDPSTLNPSNLPFAKLLALRFKLFPTMSTNLLIICVKCLWECCKPWTIVLILYWRDEQRKRTQEIENSWKHRNTKYRTAAAWFSVKQFYKLVRTVNSSESKMCRHTCGQDSLDWKSKKPLKILSTTLYIRIYKEFILATWENHSIASIHITRKDRWHSGSFPGLSNCTAQFRGVRLPGDPHDLSQSHSILIICRTLQNKDIKDI